MLTTLAVIHVLQRGLESDSYPAHVFVKDQAVVVSAPIPASGSEPRAAFWSFDGSKLLVLREATRSGESQSSIGLFDRATRSWRELVRIRAHWREVHEITWLSDNSSFFYVVGNRRPLRPRKVELETLYRVDASSGKQIALTRGEHSIQVHSSPLQPVAIYGFAAIGQVEERVNGTESRRIRMRSSVHVFDKSGGDRELTQFEGSWRETRWPLTGRAAVLEVVVTEPSIRVTQVPVDLSNGRLIENFEDWRFASTNPDTRLRLAKGSTQVHYENLHGSGKSLWLAGDYASEARAAYLASSSYHSALAPKLDAVFYESEGLGLVRELRWSPKEEYVQQLRASLRSRAMKAAEEVGRALLVYSEGELPRQNFNIDVLAGFLEDIAMLEGFVYTGDGEVLRQVNPRTLKLGYVQTKHGRAVVYGDGHVTWQNEG